MKQTIVYAVTLSQAGIRASSIIEAVDIEDVLEYFKKWYPNFEIISINPIDYVDAAVGLMEEFLKEYRGKVDKDARESN